MSARKSPAGLWSGTNEPPVEAEPAHSAYVDAPEPDPWTELIPLFPVTSFTPHSKCPHNGPIPRGSAFVCAVCHQAGKDGTPALPVDVKRLPDDPRPPEPKPKPAAKSKTKTKPQPQRRRSRSA